MVLIFPNICPPGSRFHTPGKFLETLYIPGPTLIIKPDMLGCGNSLKSVLNQSRGRLLGSLSPWGIEPCQRTAWWASVTTLSSVLRTLGALKGLKTNTERMKGRSRNSTLTPGWVLFGDRSVLLLIRQTFGACCCAGIGGRCRGCRELESVTPSEASGV